MDFRQAVEWLRENTTDMETEITQTVPGIYAGFITVKRHGKPVSVGCVAASQQEALQKLAVSLYAAASRERPPIVANVCQCRICGASADRYERFIECSANPWHTADMNTGLFMNTTPPAEWTDKEPRTGGEKA